ncbi:hypothetical protein [Nocardia grenadensis]
MPREALRRVKDAVRSQLVLDDDTAVVVRQLDCREPGCPPVETVIAVLPAGGPARRWTAHRPVAEITEDDVRDLLAATPEGD